MPRGGSRAAIRATWPTVRFLPCGSGRQGATAAGGRVSCGGRWRRTPVPDASPDQLPPATDWRAAELGSESCCTCCLAQTAATSLSSTRPIFFKVLPMTIRWVCSCTRRQPDIDCSRFVRPTVVVCHCLTQRPLCLLSQDKDGACVN